MTPTLLDLALKAGFSDPIEGWMGEAYEERLEAFAKLIIEHEAAKQTVATDQPKMYEDWYDPASCSHCGIVNGHTQHCRTVTRTAATNIRKYEPTIDLGKYAGTYGGYIKENDND